MPYDFVIGGTIVDKSSRPGKGDKVYRSVNIACPEGFVERVDLPDDANGLKLWADMPEIGAQVRIAGRKAARWFNGQGSVNQVADKLQTGAVQSTGAKAA